MNNNDKYYLSDVLTVSQHALDRFAERVLKMDQIRSSELAQQITDYIARSLEENYPDHINRPNGEFLFPDYGVCMIKKNNNVVTVEPIENSNNNDFNYNDFRTKKRKERNDVHTRKYYFRGKPAKRKIGRV